MRRMPLNSIIMYFSSHRHISNRLSSDRQFFMCAQSVLNMVGHTYMYNLNDINNHFWSYKCVEKKINKWIQWPTELKIYKIYFSLTEILLIRMRASTTHPSVRPFFNRTRKLVFCVPSRNHRPVKKFSMEITSHRQNEKYSVAFPLAVRTAFGAMCCCCCCCFCVAPAVGCAYNENGKWIHPYRFIPNGDGGDDDNGAHNTQWKYFNYFGYDTTLKHERRIEEIVGEYKRDSAYQKYQHFLNIFSWRHSKYVECVHIYTDDSIRFCEIDLIHSGSETESESSNESYELYVNGFIWRTIILNPFQKYWCIFTCVGLNQSWYVLRGNLYLECA